MDKKIQLNDRQSNWLFEVLSTYQWWTNEHMTDSEYIRMDDIHKTGYYFDWDRTMLNSIRTKWIEHNPYK